MCGLFAQFCAPGNSLTNEKLASLLSMQSWRGPDHTGMWFDAKRRASLGHNRLTILDSSSAANLPMSSRCGRYVLVYNGEIYNHIQLRRKFHLNCSTHSDSETLLKLYQKLGATCVDHLEGMFAFVIYDKQENHFFAARDHLGIKPLFYSEFGGQTLFASEAAVLNEVVGSSISEIAIKEWRVFRRPLPGRTFFTAIAELEPGCVYDSVSGIKKYWEPSENSEVVDYTRFREELGNSISAHLINDFETVSLVSGGLDSAIILALSGIKKCYTIGLVENNEFEGAEDTAGILGAILEKVCISAEDLQQAWRDLVALRKEPLSVPNEGLIYLICKSMPTKEKVVLTGEGADELLFGYDKIFRWGAELPILRIQDFVERYSYSKSNQLDGESLDWLSDALRGKSPINFLEDFFIKVHLPGLLRRMDFASMCASKEARVPFVTPALFNLMYRTSIEKRHSDGFAKTYLRKLAEELGLRGALARPKIGFSAKFGSTNMRDEYGQFQDYCLTELNWI